MGSDFILGTIFCCLGGFAAATNYVPFRGIKRWSWEIYWLIQSAAAWLLAPTVVAALLVPHLPLVLGRAFHEHPRAAESALLFGVLWGVGALAFGLAARYLGIALVYALAVALYIALGTLGSFASHRQVGALAQSHSGPAALIGALGCLAAVALYTVAGWRRQREMTPEQQAESGERSLSLPKGLLMLVLAGCMSLFFFPALDAGQPLSDLARGMLLSSGHDLQWQGLPSLIVVLWGGFLTNLVWSAILMLRNRSVRQFAGTPGANPMRTLDTSGDTLMDFDPVSFAAGRDIFARISGGTLLRNYLLAALAGVLWYVQFLLYTLGQGRAGQHGLPGWTLSTASIVIVAALWGLLLREWRGTTTWTRALVTCGLLLLVLSLVLVGYGI